MGYFYNKMAVSHRKVRYHYSTICWNGSYRAGVLGRKTPSKNPLALNPISRKPYSTKTSHVSLKERKRGWRERGSSETLRAVSFKGGDPYFYNWLGGIVDGDGSVRPHGMEVCTHEQHVQALYAIKKVCKGRVRKVLEEKRVVRTYRWLLGRKKHLIPLLENLETNIALSKRRDQINNYRLDWGMPEMAPFKFTPYWFTGIFESDGCMYVKKTRPFQITFSIAQKDKNFLERIQYEMGMGNIYFDKPSETYTWQVSAKDDLNVLVEHFVRYPFVSPPLKARFTTVRRIIRFKEMGYHLKKNRQYESRITNKIYLMNKEWE